jgi:hypothetical protein
MLNMLLMEDHIQVGRCYGMTIGGKLIVAKVIQIYPLDIGDVERWSKRVMEALGRRGGDKVGEVFVEEYLRELWERTRVLS